MNKVDIILLDSWKSYIKQSLENSQDSNLEICKQEIKSWAINKLSKPKCNPELLIKVLELLEN
jgi:hypothetical protein